MLKRKIAYSALRVSEVCDYTLSYGFALPISEWAILWVVTILGKSEKYPYCSKRSGATLGMAPSAEMYLVQRFWPRCFRTLKISVVGVLQNTDINQRSCAFSVCFCKFRYFFMKKSCFFRISDFYTSNLLIYFSYFQFCDQIQDSAPKEWSAPAKSAWTTAKSLQDHPSVDYWRKDDGLIVGTRVTESPQKRTQPTRFIAGTHYSRLPLT